MMEHPCIPCQYGMHDDHIEYPEIPAEGVMGGQHCPCKGDCADHVRNEPAILSDEPFDATALDFLRRAGDSRAR